MLRTNQDKLVKMSVTGEISSPVFSPFTYRISFDGKPLVLPGVGGITYNVKIGDLVDGFEADHVEPGVSLKNREKMDGIPDAANNAFNALACIGNQVKITSGEAKGALGTVTGKHGGIEHIISHFEDEILEKLNIGDKVLIKAYGVGLKLLDFPEVKVMNLAPELLNLIKLEARGDKLEVPVTHLVPGSIMGSGLGSNNCYKGDYDIQMFDPNIVEEYGLKNLCFGDLVAIMDTDHSYGRIYLTGAVSIAIVVHSNCITAGHGPGACTIFTSSKGLIAPVIDPQANLRSLLNLKN